MAETERPTEYWPNAIHARLSARCQLNCSFCERENWKRGDLPAEADMPGNVWQAIVDQYLPYVEGVELVGLGEPTLSALFGHACQDVVGAQKQLYFATNGMTLGSGWVLDSVGDTPRVSVSIDAWDAESYKAIRGGGGWDKLLAGIRRFRAEKPHAHLHSQYTGQPDNIDGLPQFVALAAGLGFQEVILRPMHGHSRAREDVSLRFEQERTERAIEGARRNAEAAGILFTAERPAYSKLPTGSTRASRVRRYLDFDLLEDVVCGTTVGSETLSSSLGIVTDTASTLSDGVDLTLMGSGVEALWAGAAEPVILRSARAQREAEPVIVRVRQPLIVAADGSCWACFGRHVVGSIEDAWLKLVRRARYQEFLRNRATGNALQDGWCRNCPRVM